MPAVHIVIFGEMALFNSLPNDKNRRNSKKRKPFANDNLNMA